ncbi:MAG: ATP-binding protein [Caldilineaceae bacterium]
MSDSQRSDSQRSDSQRNDSQQRIPPQRGNRSAYDLWQQQIGRLVSLRWRLTVMLGFILLCTLFVISLTVATFVRNTEKNTWFERQSEAANYAAQSVSTLVEKVSAALNLINAFDLNELETETDILRNILHNNPSLTEVAYFNTRGTVVAQASLDNLHLLTAADTAQTGLANGDSQTDIARTTAVVNTAWFQTARQGELYFDVARFSIRSEAEHQQQYLLFAMPAANQSIIAARIHISALYQVVADIRFGNNGRAYVFNQYGDIIAHSDRTVLERQSTIAEQTEFKAAINARGQWYGSYVNFENASVVGVSARVPAVNWVVMTEVPRSEVFATSRRAYVVLGGGMLAFVILMMWASAEWMEGLILTPIERLRDGAERIGRGDLTHRIDAIHQDEIGQVALAFNHMATELQELYGDLEQKIAERTAQLEQQTTELARSNAELAQFAYIASHDLQEPLRMVSNYLQLIEHRYKGQLDADADEFIRYAVDGAIRMQQLIRDLLAYSRVGTRGQAFSQVNMRQVLEQVLDNLQVAIQDRNAQITVGVLPPVMGDATQLGQLMQNLLTNALKFCEAKVPIIQITVAREMPASEWVFTVRDNGIGIDPEYFERIFLIFQRLHTRSEYPGTGIGLAICKKIVERHGGRIWVESKPNSGTSFCFTIPIAQIKFEETGVVRSAKAEPTVFDALEDPSEQIATTSLPEPMRSLSTANRAGTFASNSGQALQEESRTLMSDLKQAS